VAAATIAYVVRCTVLDRGHGSGFGRWGWPGERGIRGGGPPPETCLLV